MKKFFQLFYLNPLIVLAFSSWLIFWSITYSDGGFTELKTFKTYELCKSLDDEEFVSCFKKNNDAYLRHVECKKNSVEVSPSKSYSSYCPRLSILNLIYPGPGNPAIDAAARSIMDSPSVFKRFVFNPNTFCNNNSSKPDKEYSQEELTAEYFLAQYNICSTELENSDYVFTKMRDVFSVNYLLIYLVMTLPVLALAIYWIKRNKPFITEVNLIETFSWLSDTKKFRINIVGTIAWLVAFYIVGVVTGEYRSLNPIEEREISLWIIYFVSLYPLTVLLISNYIYSADEK